MTEVLVACYVKQAQVPDVLAVLDPFAQRKPGVFAPILPPVAPPDTVANVPDPRAEEIAAAIAPRESQPMRKEALRFVFMDGDTFRAASGETDHSMRVALGALSKALRPWDKYGASPLDLLATRVPVMFKDNGRYLGTEYHLTPLGEQVRDILGRDGHL